jgi:hypothetical protein
MSERNLVQFLRNWSPHVGRLKSLERLDKDAILAVAADAGLAFSEPEFDELVWDLEIALAAKRGEAFDGAFPLWQTMWGKTYFAYLVQDVLPSLTDEDIEAVLVTRGTA